MQRIVSFVIIFTFLVTGFSLPVAKKKSEFNNTWAKARENLGFRVPADQDDDQTTSLGNIGLDEEQMREVAENIFNISKSMSNRYSVSDGVTLSMYVFRYFAEVGEYVIIHKDLMTLVNAFEKLLGEPLAPEVHAILKQIRKLKFGKKNGKYFVRIYANTKHGIDIPLANKTNDPDSSLKEIVGIKVKDKAYLYFQDTKMEGIKKEITSFVKEPVKILGVFKKLAKELNQIYKPMIDNIDEYLTLEDVPAPALLIDFDGVEVLVKTTTVFKDITFKFNKGVALPGYRRNGEPIPSFIIGAKSMLLGLKVSVDQ